MMFLILSLVVVNAHAGDDWLCKEEASIQRGHEIAACGISKGHTEQEARESAFYAAQNEFTRVCMLSADCKSHKVTVEAKRTECEAIPQIKDSETPGENYFQFTCRRLVAFTVLQE